MPRTNKVITNTIGGEISPKMYGRTDLPLFQKAVSRLQNFIALPQGGAEKRPGSQFINYTRGNNPPRLIPFKFSDQQAYIIEATNLRFRFFKDNQAITETPKNVTALTSDNPGILTVTAHAYANGDTVALNGVVGPSSLNGTFYLVANVTANTFTLQDVFGNDISTSNLADYVSGGTVARVYEIATPYTTADLSGLAWAQSADTMYIVHTKYKPRKLTRASHTNWTLAFPAWVANPFTNNTDGDGNCPCAVTFIDTARLLFGGTVNHPETLWASQAPLTGVTKFENFTNGVKPTDAFSFTLTPIHGEVDAIEWLSSTALYVACGTFGSVRILYGNSLTEAISPIAVTAKSVTDFGAARTAPIGLGTGLMYVQRNARVLRSVDYDFLQNWYTTSNKNLVTDHLPVAGYAQVVLQKSLPDVIWGMLNNGKLVGMTYDQKEDISGWHQHYIGGNSSAGDGTLQSLGTVVSIATLPRPTLGDQVWIAVQRQINGNTINTVEYLTDWIDYPIRADYFTGTTNHDVDQSTYDNILYETQKNACMVDMATSFDGTQQSTLNMQLIANLGQNTVGAWTLLSQTIPEIGVWDAQGNFALVLPARPAHVTTGNALTLAVDSINKVFYIEWAGITNPNESVIAQYPIVSAGAVNPVNVWDLRDTHNLTPLHQSMVLDQTGQYIYLLHADTANATVRISKFDTLAGAESLISPTLGAVAALTNTPKLIISPDDSRLYVNINGTFFCVSTTDLSIINTQVINVNAKSPGALSDDGTTFAAVDVTDSKVFFIDTTAFVASSFTVTDKLQPAICFPLNDSAHVLVPISLSTTNFADRIREYTTAGATTSDFTLNSSFCPQPAVTDMQVDPATGFIFAGFNIGTGGGDTSNTLAVYDLGSSRVISDISLAAGLVAVCPTLSRTLLPSTTLPANPNLAIFTAGSAIFTELSLGQQIWKKYLSDGSGGGRAQITQFISPTVVLGTILSSFDNTNQIAAGNWYLTVNQLTGLGYLEGETVKIIADGGTHLDKIVVNGAVLLDSQVSKAFVGYGYTGIISTLNLDQGGVTGSAQGKPRNIWQVAVNMLNSLGINIGTTLYAPQNIHPASRRGSDLLDRPPPLHSGNRILPYSDSHEREEKKLHILHDEPLPCTITALDIFLVTSDDQG